MKNLIVLLGFVCMFFVTTLSSAQEPQIPDWVQWKNCDVYSQTKTSGFLTVYACNRNDEWRTVDSKAMIKGSDQPVALTWHYSKANKVYSRTAIRKDGLWIVGAEGKDPGFFIREGVIQFTIFNEDGSEKSVLRLTIPK